MSVRLVNLFRMTKYLKASGGIYLQMIAPVMILFESIGMYMVERDYEGYFSYGVVHN